MYVIEGGSKPFCFIAHPKTASRSVQAVLESAGAHNVEGHHYIDEDVCADIRDRGGTVCCIVRNPYDVMVSWYAFCQQKENNARYPHCPSFSSWLPRFLLEGNSWIERGLFYGADHCTEVIKYEDNMQLTMNVLMSHCELPQCSMPHIGASGHEHYSFYYNDHTMHLVHQYCQSELTRFGYAFEGTK